ncbi:hypothetical protein [Paraglaciecola sp. MB-3u-78]|jgi:hypothetical protein|uniref:hypothetical protein n=1 Tax=Paraglaciecola sp. MB-3u-78 TaxID=2058332 RepID=UPI000C34924C|nr:hypothetical protein [Paraglaciecola sp. MB-3u-78]PKG99982.1 hypothetical protein CXF95_04855 [Paraglaciecola sp. MB-3u-78]
MKYLTINILHHHLHTEFRAKMSIMAQFAKYWEKEGHIVNFLFGCEEYIPADILVIHVDLSETPEEYLTFARQYPRVVNLGLTDIRKRAISRNLVERGDAYRGPVIIKTDLNCGGTPEVKLGTRPEAKPLSWLQRMKKRYKLKDPGVIQTPSDYLIYSQKRKVPRSVFKNDELIVEKFLPEKHGEAYYQRRYYFLGEKEYNEIHSTSVPIHAVDSDDHLIDYWEEQEIPVQLQAYRKELKADFGKIDYVIRDGQVVVFDVNRTPSAGNVKGDPVAAKWAQTIAERLHSGIYPT